MTNPIPGNFLGSLNIQGGVMALIILIAWIALFKAIQGIFLRLLFTALVACLLLWAIGAAPEAWMVVQNMFLSVWGLALGAWRWFLSLFS